MREERGLCMGGVCNVVDLSTGQRDVRQRRTLRHSRQLERKI
jgi:hypothetical protein